MKSIDPYILIASSPVLRGLPSWREVREDAGFPLCSGPPEAMPWRDAISHVIQRPALIMPNSFDSVRCCSLTACISRILPDFCQRVFLVTCNITLTQLLLLATF
jgi:hypothetical protein